MPERIDRKEGRLLFGYDPSSYNGPRPPYPDWIFARIFSKEATRQHVRTLEIGPGTGSATRRLLEHGANPVTLVEPDERFAETLESILQSANASGVVLHESFENVDLAPNQFDLVVAATSFHWIEPSLGLRKVRRLLKPGGTAALFWNVLQVLNYSAVR